MSDVEEKFRANMTEMRNPYELHQYAQTEVFTLLNHLYKIADQDPNVQAHFRDQIRNLLARKLGLNTDEIFFGKSTTATSQLLFDLLKARISQEHPGSTSPVVLTPAPTYQGTLDQLVDGGWTVESINYSLVDYYSPAYLEKFLYKIDTKKPDVIYIANPNNPTGAYFSVEQIAKIYNQVQKYGGYVVVDEAYLRAVDPDGCLSVVQLLAKNPQGGSNASESHSRLIVCESVHKNFPTHLSASGNGTEYSSNKSKMALVYAHRDIIGDLMQSIDRLKHDSKSDKSKADFLQAVSPSREGILILQLAMLNPDYWRQVALVLVSQIGLVLERLHSFAEELDRGDGEKLLLLPDESVNGVFTIGVAHSLLQKNVRGAFTGLSFRRSSKKNAPAQTLKEQLELSGVKVASALTDHELATTYEFIRIVVQDQESNEFFLEAMYALLLSENA